MPDPRPPAPLDPEGVEAAATAVVNVIRGAAPFGSDLPGGGFNTTGKVVTDGLTIASAAITAYLEATAHRTANLPQDTRFSAFLDNDDEDAPHICWRDEDDDDARYVCVDCVRAALLANLPSQDAKEAVIEAARAEVLAQGYRSSDMARALQALDGEFWFENYVPPLVPSSKQVCGYAVTTEMDDGPLTQRCSRRPHGSEVEHYFGANLPSQRDDGEVGRLLGEAYGRVEHDRDCKKRRAEPIRKAITACTCGASDWFDRANAVLDDLEATAPTSEPEGGETT